MAKTIKFNLICDGHSVRTIEDLQNNFSIEDMLTYFEDGLLLRWLKVRNYMNEYEKVSEISTKDDVEIVKELAKIFNVEADEKDIAKSIYMLNFQKEKKQKLIEYSRKKHKINAVIANYIKEYNGLVEEIMDNAEDVSLIKTNISEIANNYTMAFQLNYRELFWKMADHDNFLVIMCFLMNPVMREYYLYIEREDNSQSEEVVSRKNEDQKQIYEWICDYFKGVNTSKIIEILGDNIHEFSGDTDWYWKDIEVKGKKYMILGIGYSDKVRSAGEHNGDLSHDDVNYKFPILDGIDFMCGKYSTGLMYMEV